jgi:hypothetical protein
MEAELGTQLSLLLVALLGAVESWILTGLRYVSTGVDKLPKPVKLILVAALSVPVAWLAGVSGLALPADPMTWDGTIVNAILLWLSAMGVNAAGNAVISREPPSS